MISKKNVPPLIRSKLKGDWKDNFASEEGREFYEAGKKRNIEVERPFDKSARKHRPFMEMAAKAGMSELVDVWGQGSWELT